MELGISTPPQLFLSRVFANSRIAVANATSSAVGAYASRMTSTCDGWMHADATDYTALEQQGRQVYIREGCWYCHSQFVRPVTGADASAGIESWRS